MPIRDHTASALLEPSSLLGDQLQKLPKAKQTGVMFQLKWLTWSEDSV